jgi:cell division protein FtsX
MAITLKDIADFVQMIATAFSAPLFYSFTAMIGFAVAIGVKRLIVDGYQ